MATSTPVAVPAARRSFLGLIFKIVLWLVLAIIIIGAVAFFWFYRAAHGSLAQLDGTITLNGLQAPVSVDRDAHGVPHLTAANLPDLFFAQGYVTAQDRLWQMDFTRRAMGGEMAEIFPDGPAQPVGRFTGNLRPRKTWVDYDKQQRLMRLRVVAERVAQQLSPRDRAFFEAYANGVNAYIQQHESNLPIEFRILRYKPRPWTPTDSLLVGIGMSQLLNPQYETEYWREKMAAKLPPELMADLYPPDSPRDHPPASEAGIAGERNLPIQNPPSNILRKTSQFLPGRFSEDQTDSCESCLPGSNNWVVSGAHTVSGKAAAFK